MSRSVKKFVQSTSQLYDVPEEVVGRLRTKKAPKVEVTSENRPELGGGEHALAALRGESPDDDASSLGSPGSKVDVNALGIQQQMARVGRMKKDTILRRVRALTRSKENRALSQNEMQELCALVSNVFTFARQLPLDSLEDLVTCMKFRTCVEREVLCRQGEQGDAFYMVLSGGVQISTVHEQRFDGVVRTKIPDIFVRAGSSFGDLSILRRQPRVATCTVDRDGTDLLYVEADDFRRVFFNIVDEMDRDALRFIKLHVPCLRNVEMDEVVQLSRLLTSERVPKEHVFDFAQADVALRIIRKGTVQLRVPEQSLMRMERTEIPAGALRGEGAMVTVLDYERGHIFGSRITAANPEALRGWQGFCTTRVECLKALTAECLNPDKLPPQRLVALRNEMQFLLNYHVGKVVRQLKRRAEAAEEAAKHHGTLLDPSSGLPALGRLPSRSVSELKLLKPPVVRPAEKMAEQAVAHALSHSRAAMPLPLARTMGIPPTPMETPPRLGIRSMRALALAEAELATEETTIARTKRTLGTREASWNARGDESRSGVTSVDKYNCFVSADRSRQFSNKIDSGTLGRDRARMFFDNMNQRPVPQFRQMATSLEMPYMNGQMTDTLMDMGNRGLAIDRQRRAQSSLG